MGHSIKICTRILFLSLALLAHKTSAQTTITLAVEATYPKEQAALVYEPLQAWLKKQTGFDVTIESADNYYFYWRAAKSEQPDFTLDAAHVAAYRIEQKNYLPLARLKEDVSYHLIAYDTPGNDQSIGEYLVGQNVVTLPNPNMGSVLFDSWFTDLFLQPQKVVTALSWQDAIEQVFAQSANAAIIPSYLFELYPNFLSLKQSPNYPGLTLLASPNVDPAIRNSFQQALIKLGQDEESYAVLGELNSEGFIEADAKDYEDLASVLSEDKY